MCGKQKVHVNYQTSRLKMKAPTCQGSERNCKLVLRTLLENRDCDRALKRNEEP